MSKLALSFGVGVLLLFVTGSAWACKCAGRLALGDRFQPCGTYWSSDAVFVGTAERLERDSVRGSITVTFSVERRLRGEVGEKAEVLTSGSSASCGYPFKQGETYLVYGRKSADGKFHEALCGPTILLKDAQQDLAYAAEIDTGKTGTRIYGFVQEDRQTTLKDQRTLEPVAGIEITAIAETSKKRYKTRTDERGLYIFSDVLPDIYKITAALPTGLRELRQSSDPQFRFASVDLDRRRCDGEYFTVTRQGSISGKVANFDSRGISNPWNPKPAQPFLTLFAIDPDNTVTRGRVADERWAYRPNFEFFFPTVPAGNYLLVMNPKNCPYPNNGTSRAYYPGVASEDEARIITVKEGQQLVLDDFRSLPLLRERWFAGAVLNADRTPAANVEVRLRTEPGGTCGENGETRVNTDESGRFRVKGYESYVYIIDAVRQPRNGQKEMYAPPVRLSDVDDAESIQLVLTKTF